MGLNVLENPFATIQILKQILKMMRITSIFLLRKYVINLIEKLQRAYNIQIDVPLFHYFLIM